VCNEEKEEPAVLFTSEMPDGFLLSDEKHAISHAEIWIEGLPH
jgi:hypothetical protein